MRNRWLAASFLAAAAVVGLAACGSNSSTPSGSTTSNPPAAAPTSTSTGSTDMAAGIKTTTVNGRVVLTNASGFVLYWYTPDTASSSTCNGGCSTAWPPLLGTPSFASGVTLTGKLGTIKRSGGEIQATYDGHPLYLYKADTTSTMATGNSVGQVWWLMTATGKKIMAKVSSTSGSSGGGSGSGSGSGGGSSGGGYGY